MKYLGCIELLSLALQLLRPEQRDQVPVSKLKELAMLVNQAIRRNDDDNLRVQLYDVANAIDLASQNTAIQFLPASMKGAFIDGLEECLKTVCSLAWDYYSERDVPEDQDRLLRTIVEYHYLQGDVVDDF